MHITRLKLHCFRSYGRADIALRPGAVIITGANASGKTSLLEAILFAACGRSFRTSREAEMIRCGQEGFRVEIDLAEQDVFKRRSVTFRPGPGVEVQGADDSRWLSPGNVLCFSPDDLELVKGSPSVRRRFLDDAIGAEKAAGARLARDYQKVLAQRNSCLKRARTGRVPAAAIAPWDRQLARLALEIFHQRDRFCRELEPAFSQALAEITGKEQPAAIIYRSQIDPLASLPDAEDAVVAALEERRPRDIERAATGLGTHRDDIEFQVEGRDQRAYGSQGEQRTVVLAVLLARWLSAQRSGRGQALLLLDDVMSELDPDRRRRLMSALLGAPAPGQVLITAADSHLFTPEELAASLVLELGSAGEEAPDG